jgi:hypothetical protein
MAWWGTDVPAERAALAVNDLVEACDGVERLKSFLMQLGSHGAPWAEGVADGVYVGQAIERDVGAGRCRRCGGRAEPGGPDRRCEAAAVGELELERERRIGSYGRLWG